MPLTSIASNSSSVESSAPAASYAANATLFGVGALSMNELMMIIGTLLAVATFCVNLFFQRRRDAREKELHDRIMEKGN